MTLISSRKRVRFSIRPKQKLCQDFVTLLKCTYRCPYIRKHSIFYLTEDIASLNFEDWWFNGALERNRCQYFWNTPLTYIQKMYGQYAEILKS